MRKGFELGRRTSRAMSATLGLMVASLLILLVASTGLASPGNNGTVKIDGVEFDQHPNNEPHVGCIFEVDWYGFEASVHSMVTFKIWPPSGGMETILDDLVTLDADGPEGGGSEAGLDLETMYDLGPAVAGFFEHPQQGFHVKLTINTEGSQGADVKNKVFWVTGCEEPNPSPS